MKKYKGWIVYEVTSGFFGGSILLIRQYNWWERFRGKQPEILPRFFVNEHWGSKEPVFWLDGLYEAARKYIDSGAKEAIESGCYVINLSV